MHAYHPSMTPGAIIGYRKNGCPIRLIAGGSGEGETGDGGNRNTSQTGGGQPNGDGDGNGQQQDGQNSGQSGTGGRDDAGTGSGTDGGAGDDHTARTIAAIRNDFKTERTRRQAAEKELADVKAAQAALQQSLDADKNERQKQMDALAKALGLKEDDKPPTADELAAQLAEARRASEAAVQAQQAAEANAADALAQARRERAVMQAAPKHDAHGLALLDSRSFMETVGRLDPNAGDFADQLGEAIDAAVEANPAYKVTPKRTSPPARSSGGEFNSQPDSNRQWTDDDVAKASPRELEKAAKAGLLRDLGIGQPRVRRGYTR